MKSMHKTLLASIASLIAAASVYAADVAGTWSLSVESPRGVRESTLTLTQSGEELTGTLKGQRGETPVTGTLKDNALELNYTLEMQGTGIDVKYTGIVDGDTMSGTIDFGGMGEGKFTGKKQ